MDKTFEYVQACFSHTTANRFCGPGRTELSGSHTDHQHGCVLAAAVDLETVAEVTLNGAGGIRVK